MKFPVIDKPESKQPDMAHGTLTSYVVGFVLSIALTLAAYSAVVNRSMPDSRLVVLVIALAMAQLLVQLIFFLHMGKESRPRWNLQVFGFMLMVLLIIVLGSLWIMHNLNYNMMSPHDTDDAIMHDEGISH
jgi:cytochrome o ubiquinol oxidase subunit IV